MSVKVIAVDMDGTFLTSDNQYDKEKFMRQYEYMKDNDIHFVVASGNQYYQLRSFFPEIQKEITFIAENGGYIVDQDKDVFVAQLKDGELEQVLEAIEQYPEINKIVCGKKSAYINENVDNDYFDRLLFYYPRMQRVAHFENLDDSIFKIFLSCQEDNFEYILNDLKEKVGHIMTPVDCGHFGIDLIIPGINKAHGIQLLMERWNIAGEDVMAFGDSGNDIEMLEHATFSFAMANAKKSVKDISRYTISSNNDGGVLEVIDWLIHKEKMFK
ncbi:Cof-type HAD-IIB family hydrolase [Candidatus Stoquefichus massiliensis]|uniref:Cof-type HAD-IIB family hydrolase n=1 Tax=Candidatus Stoquefichus massiliensis TaxID=1470350 RepID=UPI000484063B|nr:Cof-type HAD-IIB family hydrolase [Candidatus Stoquefichus massiliensis]